MDNQTKWRRSITIWVAAICVTAIVCSWLLMGYRYQAIIRHDGPVLSYDKITGRYHNHEGKLLPLPE